MFIVGGVAGFRCPVDTLLRIGVLEVQGGALWVWFGHSFLVQLPAPKFKISMKFNL